MSKNYSNTTNEVVLFGNVGNFEFKTFSSGQKLLEFSLCTEHAMNGANGTEYVPDWHKCLLWGDRAANVKLTKGEMLLVFGELQYRKFQKETDKPIRDWLNNVLAPVFKPFDAQWKWMRGLIEPLAKTIRVETTVAEIKVHRIRFTGDNKRGQSNAYNNTPKEVPAPPVDNNNVPAPPKDDVPPAPAEDGAPAASDCVFNVLV